MSVVESLAAKIPDRLKPPLRTALQVSRRLHARAMLLSPVNRFKTARFKNTSPLKLNIGCGKVRFPGWVNIDIEPGADLVLDVRKGLPFDDDSVDLIYNEHLLEHLTFEEGGEVVMQFRRCLKEGGVLRMAMPDLDYIIEKYNTDWKNQDWLSWPGYEFIRTRGRMVNVVFRWSWGHKYLYNEEDLRAQLTGAGFQRIVRCEWNKSSHSELAGLETRKDSKLIIEATKE